MKIAGICWVKIQVKRMKGYALFSRFLLVPFFIKMGLEQKSTSYLKPSLTASKRMPQHWDFIDKYPNWPQTKTIDIRSNNLLK